MIMLATGHPLTLSVGAERHNALALASFRKGRSGGVAAALSMVNSESSPLATLLIAAGGPVFLRGFVTVTHQAVEVLPTL
jgi:hypothetical protein